MITNMEQIVIDTIKNNPSIFQRQMFDIVKDKCNVSEYYMIKQVREMVNKGLVKKYNNPDRFRHTFYEVVG